jgi:hypothetical protein
MARITLLVFEGRKTEPQIFESLKNYFFNDVDGSIIMACYNTNIMQLWQDVTQNTINGKVSVDMVSLLKSKGVAGLDKISSQQVSEIHLFFDHDAHLRSRYKLSDDEYNTRIEKMLATFNDESSLGKLWISYPMIEAIKHCRKECTCCLREISWKITENQKYKNFIGRISSYVNFAVITKDDWCHLLKLQLQRISMLLSGSDMLYNHLETLLDYIDATNDSRNDARFRINNEELNKYLCKIKKEIAVISPVPLFLLGYFGEKRFNLQIKNNEQTDTVCSGICYKEPPHA